MSMSDLKPFRLTTGANIIRSPTWAPAGDRIAFTATFSQIASAATQIWTVAYPAGGPQRQLTNVPGGAVAPAWSPDGHSLLYVTPDTGGKPQIWRMDPDNPSATPTQLTNLPAVDEYPAWSPDGKNIAFDSDRDGHLRVWVMDADGANARPVSPTSMAAIRPSWSPDGTRLAFEAPKGTDTEIYVMPVDGSSPPVDVTNDPARADHAPSWR
jgi:TolB protein